MKEIHRRFKRLETDKELMTRIRTAGKRAMALFETIDQYADDVGMQRRIVEDES